MKLNVERTPGVDKGTLGYQRSVPGRFKAEVANEVSQSCSGKKKDADLAFLRPQLVPLQTVSASMTAISSSL